jgi:hypothetical protein
MPRHFESALTNPSTFLDFVSPTHAFVVTRFSYKSNESLSESVGGWGGFVMDLLVNDRFRSCPPLCSNTCACCCWRCMKLLFVKLVRDAADIIDALGIAGGIGGASESLSVAL